MSKEEKSTYTIKADENLGEVKIADDVVSIIAGLAAMEVDGVSSMAGNATRELISKLGMKSLSKGVKVDVLKYRLENEYNVEIRLDTLPYEHIRWIENTDIDLDKLTGTSDMKKVKDLKGRPLLLFVNDWSIRMTLERNNGLELSEFGR